ncbi:Heme oxygenase [Geodermatophilus telluris]|uniref:Heme oxygenase n=1 Tax=Geodermatophilus telluris TaxID=1190417 RepID=A0A1G6N0L6_9ACTN|nr:biliverdin-producing heme oxygenase [Geodermatophilus telluris]SDC60675.1 Heme oxygenase [Geodermatophilus telluris]
MPRDAGGAGDVLRDLRTATAEEHDRVESTLDLMDPHLDRDRLVGVLGRLHAFWVAAEAGLDAWARRRPDDAAALDWARRRRAGLYAADLRALGADPEAGTSGGTGRPGLPEVRDTDEALGRLYVLEGSTLGGTFIDRHLATLPGLAGGPRLRCFSPYGADTGAMWHAFRRVTREHVAADGDAGRVVTAARATFGALADWCAPAAQGTTA